MKTDDLSPLEEVQKWILMALQVLAMALCACLIARMIMEDAFSVPHQMCVETNVEMPTSPQ